MVSKIASVILNFNEPNSYVDRNKALEIAEVILQVQEDNGMLPPPDETNVATSSIVYCYYKVKTYGECERLVENEDGELDYKMSKLWEPEDE